MSTPYSDVINASTLKFQDYRLNKLKVEDPDNWVARMEGFMLGAISLFRGCRTSLSDRDEALKQFNQTLNDDEIDILSDCIVIKWKQRNLSNTIMLNSLIQDKNSAKRVNEPAMISANRLLIAQDLEDLSNKISDYGFSDYLSGATS